MKNRHGQALIIVVIIIAVIMAVFANSLTTRLRYHAQEETEIYQREQALYLAEIGINKMIFNINSGTTYNDGDTVTENFSGIGNYTAIYHTPDNSGFGGSSYIESVGTVGEISRKVFASVQSGGSSDAFKYCLYTKKGKYKKTNDDGSEITFTNKDYGSSYYYNNTSGTVTPYPDWSWYTDSANCPQGITFVERDYSGKTVTYNPFKKNDDGKVVYIHYTGKKKNATLTIEFVTSSFMDWFNGKSTIQISIITDYPVVIFKNIGEYALPFMGIVNGLDITWNPIYYDSNHQYPAFIHKPVLTTSKSHIQFNYNDPLNSRHTFKINGLLYSNSPVKIKYGLNKRSNWGFINIRSELIAKSLTTDWDYSEDYLGYDVNNDNRMTTETIFDYDPDDHSNYFLYPPPHFIVPDNVTKVLPGSFREEY